VQQRRRKAMHVRGQEEVAIHWLVGSVLCWESTLPPWQSEAVVAAIVVSKHQSKMMCDVQVLFQHCEAPCSPKLRSTLPAPLDGDKLVFKVMST